MEMCYSVSDTGVPGEKKSKFYQQESNLGPSRCINQYNLFVAGLRIEFMHSE